MELFIVGFVLENPGVYLSELCEKVASVSGINVSKATMCRLIHRHGITRKKIRLEHFIY